MFCQIIYLFLEIPCQNIIFQKKILCSFTTFCSLKKKIVFENFNILTYNFIPLMRNFKEMIYEFFCIIFCMVIPGQFIYIMLHMIILEQFQIISKTTTSFSFSSLATSFFFSNNYLFPVNFSNN